MSVEERVINLIINSGVCNSVDLSPESVLSEILVLGEADKIVILLLLEDEFDFSTAEGDDDSLTTVQDVINFVQGRIAA